MFARSRRNARRLAPEKEKPRSDAGLFVSRLSQWIAALKRCEPPPAGRAAGAQKAMCTSST
jgi:hypothetical protein